MYVRTTSRHAVKLCAGGREMDSPTLKRGEVSIRVAYSGVDWPNWIYRASRRRKPKHALMESSQNIGKIVPAVRLV